MNWAREPLETSLDAENSKEPNEPLKSIPLHWTYLKKIHICIFAVLIFSKFLKIFDFFDILIF